MAGRAKGFYSAALKEAEREALESAREVEGLDEEVALLRVRLKTLIEEQPEKAELLLKHLNALIRAAAIRYRISRKAEEDLYQSVLGVLKGLGTALGLEGADGI